MGLSVKILNDYKAVSQFAADFIFNVIREKPTALIALATGNSPQLTYASLVNKVIHGKPDVSQITFIGLDEWVGIPSSDSGSCHHFLFHHLFEPLRISQKRIHLFDALSDDLQRECIDMDNLISEKNGIDLMVVGIGMNGHIGFNEPGVDWNLHSHVVNLDTITKTVGQKYFDKVTNLTQGITLGMQHILNARYVLLLANGLAKSEIIKQTLEGEVTNAVPATILRLHTHAMAVLDVDAASKLTAKKM